MIFNSITVKDKTGQDIELRNASLMSVGTSMRYKDGHTVDSFLMVKEL